MEWDRVVPKTRAEARKAELMKENKLGAQRNPLGAQTAG